MTREEVITVIADCLFLVTRDNYVQIVIADNKQIAQDRFPHCVVTSATNITALNAQYYDTNRTGNLDNY